MSTGARPRLSSLLPALLIAIIAVGAALGGHVSSAVGAAEEPDVYRTVLPNGMRAIVRERPGTDVVAISVATRGGSRDERAETVEQRITKLHQDLKITPDQETKWNEVAQDMRENAAAMDKLIAATRT